METQLCNRIKKLSVLGKRVVAIQYLRRLLGCLPALLYWLLRSVPSSGQHTSSLADAQHALTIPLIALPVFVLLRLRQLRNSFHLLKLSLETLLDTWLVHFVAFNLGSLAYLGGWVPAKTYLACLISFGIICPKPAYLGPSKLRIMDPETFAAEVLNKTYLSVVGFSASKLLTLTPEKLQEKVRDAPKAAPNGHFPTKRWVVWLVSEAQL
ncbi:hypothetical protein PtA15_5A703 [Puccinia triticina]|uniref:Uncharacterized protein n=1 Tax=Puccinia triticina TaxID=208348 RepID=A0ABY7CJ38_9BASI|nr:uncharacterized protein PtA15_5A703 [Puccinia triticina]WAQ85129.1 hypothetical protein PtA15_5A703 [Puccinia triticina]